MSAPESYTPDYSFSGFQTNSQGSPLRATKIDAELASIAKAITNHAAANEDT